MTVPSGMRNFCGACGSSVMNHPPRLAALAEGLYSSIFCRAGGIGLASTSLTRIGGKSTGAGLDNPGEPPSPALGRQLAGSPHVFNGAFWFTSDRENP